MSEARYPCWCDGSDGCECTTPEPFGLCPECTRFHHGRLPRMGLTADDIRLDDPPLTQGTS